MKFNAMLCLARQKSSSLSWIASVYWRSGVQHYTGRGISLLIGMTKRRLVNKQMVGRKVVTTTL